MPKRARQIVITFATLGSLVYAFWPPGNPGWIGVAGTFLGLEPLARARDEIRRDDDD